MRENKLIINNNFQKKNFNQNNIKRYQKKFSELTNKILEQIDNTQNIFHLLSNKFRFNFKYKSLNKFKKFNNIVVIGMGGSILGAEAIYEFFKFKINKKIHFLNNIDIELIENLKKELSFKETLFLIISKSGSTIETISNMLVLDIIKKNSKNILIISEKNNFLHKISKKYNLFFIDHKNYIGGRYSVLSEVGIVPAYLMDLQITRLRKNLNKFLKGNNKNFLKDSTVKLTSFLKQKKFNNLVFLNYSPKLEKFLNWMQQLIAESLGKKGFGFLPLISNVPKDHHSLLQLYLDGPNDKIFYIFHSNEKYDKKIKTEKFFNEKSFLRNKTLCKIKKAQANALIKTLKKKKINYREFQIKKEDEEALGELFSYFILETAIIGKLSNINPFNQPAVEQVKKETQKLLS